MIAEIILTGVLLADLSGPAAASRDVRIVHEAILAARANLVTGRGAGRYRKWDTAETLSVDATFQVAFEREKFNADVTLHLVNGHKLMGPNRRAFVSDGSALFSRSYERELSDGAPFEVWGTTEFSSASDGIETVLHWRGLVPIERIENKPVLRSERLPNGNIRVFFDMPPNNVVTVEAARDVGYNAIRWVVGPRDDRPGGRAEFTADWTRDGQVWYVRRRTGEQRGRTRLMYRDELELTSFQANPKLPADLFTLQSLKVETAKGIADQRAGKAGQWHRVEPPAAARAKQLDDLAAQLDAMPVESSAPPPPYRPRARWYIAAVNVVAVAALGWLWRRSRRKRAALTSSP